MFVDLLRRIFLFGLVLTALLTIKPQPSLAQRYHVQNFREQDGVSSNSVYNAAQDSLGNMWFATRNGLTVFNGINWRAIRSDDPACPRGEGMVAIDDKGVVWLADRRLPLKVSRLVEGCWQKLPSNQAPGRFSEVYELKTWVDANGKTTLVVSTFNGSVQIWQNDAWLPQVFDNLLPTPHSLIIDKNILLVFSTSEVLALDLNSPHEPYPLAMELPPGHIHGVCSDANNQIIWVIGDQWLAQFKNRKLVEVFPVPNLFHGKKKPGLSACPGPNGGIYFVDYAHIYYFHPNWGLEVITPANGVITDGGNQVMMDRENNIWICSTRGISKIMSRRLACYNDDHGLLAGEVSSVIQRASGTMVLGQRRGLTILDPDPRTLSFDDGPLDYSRVTDLAEDSAGQLWIAANHKGLGLLKDDDSIQWYGPDEGLAGPIFAVMPHPDHGLFVGTGYGLFRQLGGRFEKIELPVVDDSLHINIRRLIPLSTGGFVIATRNCGLFFWLDGILTQLPGDKGTGSNNTFTVFEHPDGRLWVGSDNGLFVVQSGKLVKTTAPDPEIDRPVYAIVEDDLGRFWFGTDEGATIWDGNHKTRLTAKKGLLGSETNRDALMCDEKGHIWIGTDSGVSVYKQELDTPITVAPILSLTNIMINGKRYPTDKPLQIEGPLASLVVIFHAPSFSSEEHLVFSARSAIDSGIEPPYHLIHWPGIMPMTNVPPGQFQVEIVGRTSEGLATNTVTTPLIVITQPLKDRWYFQAMQAVVVALLLWLVFAYFSGRRYARRLEEEVRHQTRDLRKSEEVSRMESERLARTLESISDGVIVVDGQSRVILFNSAAAVIFGENNLPQKGCALEDLLPKKSLLNPDHLDQYEQLLKNPAGVRLVSEQVAISNGKNQVCWLEISAVPITESPGGLVFAFRNITKRRQAEQDERRNQKLESLGLLAGGIAHDFNNLLTIMMGNLNLAEGTLVTTGVESAQLEKVRRASKRAQNLTRQLLTFAKGGGPVREAANLIPIIQDSASLNLSGSNVDCQLDLPADLSWANVDSDQIAQVIGNLVINARQAMSGGGIINITGFNVDSWPGLSENKKFVVIEIKDHGNGISGIDQLRIFDPYFTTKETGSGLGLAIAHSIAEKHFGQLTVESTPGRGSVFRLILPACDEVLPGPAPDAIQKTVKLTNSLNILFMDDEEEIRIIFETMLEQLNHQCFGVVNGETARTAYAKAAKEGHPFDLAILDLTIPGGMGGLETLGELQKLNPKVQVIVASGYSDDPVMSNFKEYGFAGILRKPFSKDDLQRVIGELIIS